MGILHTTARYYKACCTGEGGPFALPPNTTHLTQPLDKGCFGPLKMAWQFVCHKYAADNPGKVVTKYQFSQLLKQAWMQSTTVENITGGFKVTGVCTPS